MSAAATVKAAVTSAVRDAVTAALGDDLRALVLTGSLARDEGTVVRGETGARLLGDAEWLLVVRGSRRLPAPGVVERLAAEAERALAGQHIEADVGLTACPPAFLRRLRPHIFAYELRACGEVVWGDRGVLRLIPAFPASAIPREDAWRLLCNRLVEHLDALAADPPAGQAVPPALYYKTVKLYLDMATSLLAFAGAFEAGYAARAARLRELAAGRALAPLPFPLQDLAARVEACTRFKLTGAGGPPATWELLHEAMACAERIWRFELSVLTGEPADAPVAWLLDRWMAQQPLPGRLRGWLQVARTQGWLDGWSDRRRWPRLMWRASPRYWVYAAAADLLFGADGGPAAQAEGGCERWRERLPARAPQGALETPAWRRLARDVAWNYQTFLVQTRS